MPNKLRWKLIVIACVFLGCLAGIIQLPRSKEELLANWRKNIRLGLDLKGGSQIVMQIQVQDAFKAEADRAIDRLREALGRAGVTYVAMERNEPGSVEAADAIQITIRGVQENRVADFRRIADDVLGHGWTLLPEEGTGFRLAMRSENASRLRQDTVTQSINTLDRRVNGLGVAETSIQQRGGSDGGVEILIQLPGIDDTARVKRILQTKAMLEWASVVDGPFPSSEAAMAVHNGTLPPNARLVRGTSRSGEGENWWLLSRSPVVTGRDLRDVRAVPGEVPGRWDTAFVLAPDAAERFGRFTGSNINNRLAIVLDNEVLSAPRIDSTVSDRGRISGAPTLQEASDLALNLRAGSLPAGVKVIEERTVGPSLGADSIRRGVTAGAVGLVLVVASMLAYYRGAGLNAVLALLLNTMGTVAALSCFGATWTLPGIAGLVLSIGMAVDSNVLIFERIKEELRSGRRIAPAISSGFKRAFGTIVDTHVTTVVASAFLFLFGTGPVRGFAVTLVIGLLANLFTAVFVSRAIFDVQLWLKPKLPSLSIGGLRTDLFNKSDINFMRRRALTLGISVLMIILSAAALLGYGLKPGLDFRGGTLTTVKFAPAPAIDDLRRTLSSGLQGEISVQQIDSPGRFIIGTELAPEDSLTATREEIGQILSEKYGATPGRLDLNNTNQYALYDRLRGALSRRGVLSNDNEVRDLAARILSYRDGERSGLIGDLNELTTVAGVDQSVLTTIKEECGVGRFNTLSVEMVGPRAGAKMRNQAMMATLGALGGMLVYIAFRFKWISGVAAVVATIHDVIITLGLFALTGREINLNIIAALLTLIGYSMNDKIVVFDRVRENLRMSGRAGSFLQLVNQSINQTMSRTLLTAGPTLLACLALYFLGGEVLDGIAFALLTGIVVGTYSSIFVASSLLVIWNERPWRARKAAAPAA